MAFMTNRTNDLSTNRKMFDRKTNNYQLFERKNKFTNDDRLNRRFRLGDET